MQIKSSLPNFAIDGHNQEIHGRETEKTQAGIGADKLADQLSKTPASDYPVLPPDKEAAAHGIRYFYQEEPGIYRGGVPFKQSGFDWLRDSKGVSVEIDLRSVSEKPPTASM